MNGNRIVTTDSRQRDGMLDPTDHELQRTQLGTDVSDGYAICVVPEVVLREAGLPGPTLIANGMTTAQMSAIAWALIRAGESIEADVRARMTRPIAHKIRRLRITKNYTWRSIARAMHGKAGAWEPVSNQLAGMALCKVAAETFSEDSRQEPWN